MVWPRHTLHVEHDEIVPPVTSIRSPNGLSRIYLLVHGFNNDETQAQARYQAFRKRIAEYIGFDEDRIWEFYWPGYESIVSQPLRQYVAPRVAQGLYTAASYYKQVPKARHFGELLGRYLLQLRARFQDTEVILIGHSLGCRLIVEALAKMETSHAANSRVPAILLMAGAIPVEHLRPGGSLNAAVRFPQRRIALFSTRDTVLRYAFPPGQRLARDAAWPAEAMGLHGAPRECWTARDQTVLRHGDYWAHESTTPNVVRLFGKSTHHALPYSEIVPRENTSPAALPEWKSGERKISG